MNCFKATFKRLMQQRMMQQRVVQQCPLNSISLQTRAIVTYFSIRAVLCTFCIIIEAFFAKKVTLGSSRQGLSYRFPMKTTQIHAYANTEMKRKTMSQVTGSSSDKSFLQP